MSLPFRPRRSADAAPLPPAAVTSQAFDDLVLAHYARLCEFACRMVGSPAAAEDIVQDVFVRIWRHHEEFNYTDPLPYLYRAVKNRAVSYHRQERFRAGWLVRIARGFVELRSPPTDSAEIGELATAIEAALAALPERRRLIFTMHREQALSYRDIARILGISVKTVETQMGRALKTLRERLASYR